VPDPAVRFADWLHGRTIPFWLAHGVDHDQGGFHEKLDADRRPVPDAGKRIMVQARQLYVAADHALLTGSTDARAAADGALSFMSDRCRHPDGGWRFSVARDGNPQDDTRDLYAHAFALFAFAWHHRLDPAGGAKEAATATLAFLDERMTHPRGGYHEALDTDGRPANAIRRQNPHMHLFESSLALFEATGDGRALARARAIEALLETRFLDPGNGALREVFSPDWGPAGGDRYEAGHQYEWAWLLAERARLDGRPVSPAAEGLYRNALALTGPGGAVALSHTLDGEVLDATERTWGLTEALKAHLARLEAGDAGALPRAIETFDRMWARHVAPAPEGGWLDKYTPGGAPDRTDMTAATGYHIYVAIAELARVAGA